MKDILGREIKRDEHGREFIIYQHDQDGFLFRQKTPADFIEEALYENELKRKEEDNLRTHYEKGLFSEGEFDKKLAELNNIAERREGYEEYLKVNE